jgi:hypothetical protein
MAHTTTILLTDVDYVSSLIFLRVLSLLKANRGGFNADEAIMFTYEVVLALLGDYFLFG